MITLHTYILRELLKTFGLSVVALTALFTLGGGVYNVMQFEGVTSGDLFTVLPMLLPIVITLTMPVAGLFAATMTYGRLAADNELVAARAAGINIHRLFLAAVLLAIFVALFTMVSVNLVIPGFMKQIEYFARGNVRDLAFHRLLRRGYIQYGQAGKEQYMLTAQRVQAVGREQLVEKGFDPPGRYVSYFWVEQPTFLMIGARGELKRFLVAEGGLCQFDTAGAKVLVTVYVKDARYYEVGQRVVQVDTQKIGPYEAPIRFPLRPSMVDLQTLCRWRDAPWDAPDQWAAAQEFLARLRAYLFYRHAAEQLQDAGTLTLHDDSDALCQITVDAVAAGRKDLHLTGLTVALHDAAGGGRPTRYIAPEGRLTARPSPDGQVTVELTLHRAPERPVLEYNPRSAGHDTPRERESIRLDSLRLPPVVVEQTAGLTPASVLDPRIELPTDRALADERIGLQQAAEKLRRKVSSLIHFRLGFSSSALVTVLMGAALGVMFRGARALAAFGLACIPFGIVTILMLMGKQLGEKAGTATVGPYVIWGGLALVALADAGILRWGVRR